MLPRYLEKDGVVAVGEIGFDSMTPAEDEALHGSSSLRRSTGCPVLVHTPHRDKVAGTRRTLDIVRDVDIPPELVADRPQQRADRRHRRRDAAAGWASRSTRSRRWTSDRMVRILQEYGLDRMLVNSAADWGISDPLKVSKTATAMREAGFAEDDDRPARVAEPGRVLRPERAARAARRRRSPTGRPRSPGSSVLRGERPDS